MVEECSEPNLTPRYRGAHHELSMTIKCQKCSESIKNCKCQKIGHPCMTCKNRGTLDKYGECTCCINCGKSQIGNSCDCCEICGEPKDFCLGCCNACKEVPCECTCSYCQQPNCICCEDCQEYPCTCGKHNEQNFFLSKIFILRFYDKNSLKLIIILPCCGVHASCCLVISRTAPFS